MYNLSKSKYCRGLQCKDILYYDKHNPLEAKDTEDSSIMENGAEVGRLARGLFGPYLNVSFNNDLSKMIEETKRYLENDNCVVTEASFIFDGNFCSVDILVKKGNKYYIYEVKSSSNSKKSKAINEDYLNDLSYQVYVLRSLGLDVDGAFLVQLNSNYVRGKELELDKLFAIKDLTIETLNKQDEVETKIKEIKDYMEEDQEPIIELDNKCNSPYECPYFDFCKRKVGIKGNSVFDFSGTTFSKKINLYKLGLITFSDLYRYNSECKKPILTENELKQIEITIGDDEEIIDIEAIQRFLDSLNYPLYLLDFETYSQPIPEFIGTSPNQKIPFQYSLHIINSKDDLKDLDNINHKEFLAEVGTDPRRNIAEALVRDIPMNATTMAYNKSFEENRLKELASIFPDLSDHLLSISNNLVDLADPFKNKSYSSKKMQNKYTIKLVLPALFQDDPSLDYHNLEQVHNGVDAMNIFLEMRKMAPNEVKDARENLLKYCCLDTFAMVKILSKLYEICSDKKKKIES